MTLSRVSLYSDLSGKVFIFPEETETAHVRLTVGQSSFSTITVCHRTFTDLTRSHAFFSLATPSNQNEFLTFWNGDQKKIMPHHNSPVSYTVDYTPNVWHSMCTTWDSSTGLVQLWFNGRLLSKKYISDSWINGLPIVILGQEQDSYGGGFDIRQSFTGMISDVHMWDYELSSCEIQSYVNDQNYTPGNIINWRALDFQITGRVLVEYKQVPCNLP
ncbi:hypothetical protein NL108_014375, partial [Boleophthalmus pectinirostris]